MELDLKQEVLKIHGKNFILWRLFHVTAKQLDSHNLSRYQRPGVRKRAGLEGTRKMKATNASEKLCWDHRTLNLVSKRDEIF